MGMFLGLAVLLLVAAGAGTARAANRPAPKKTVKRKDETPIPPFEDPKRYRAEAAAALKRGDKKAAIVANEKAEALNTAIRIEKKKRGLIAGFEIDERGYRPIYRS